MRYQSAILMEPKPGSRFCGTILSGDNGSGASDMGPNGGRCASNPELRQGIVVVKGLPSTKYGTRGMSPNMLLSEFLVMSTSSGATIRTKDRAPIRILIADDHDTVRQMVRSILTQHSAFDVIGEVEDGRTATVVAQKLKPDVVVLNVNMPVMNGLEAAREIRAQQPETVIVILSSNADRRVIEEARRIGCQGYVAKTDAANDLIKTIEAALDGNDFVLLK
jgi:CheY-like chemotaxis protein